MAGFPGERRARPGGTESSGGRDPAEVQELPWRQNRAWYRELWVTVAPGGSRETPVLGVSPMGTRLPAAGRKLLCVTNPPPEVELL